MTEGLEIITVGETLHVCVTGKLTKEDYEAFAPLIDQQIHEHGKIRVLFQMEHFHGWSAGAMWEDLKFDLKHWKDIERLAIVGDAKWEAGMAVFCKPFTVAKIQYFDSSEIDRAKEWLEIAA